MLYIFGLALHVIMFHPEASLAMDTKCAIKSSCSLSGCHPPEHTDPMTVNPASIITLNCTIITGELTRNMTWNQALERVRNGTSKGLVLEQSISTKGGGNYSCRCTTIKLARALTIVRPLTSSPNDIIKGRETEIKCVFSGWPLPQTVYWLKNSKLITNGTEEISHSLQKNEDLLYSILRFPPGREEQEGDYLCHATNSIPGWSSSINRTIQMIYECPIPKGPTNSQDPEISAGIFTNVNLTCLIDWDPADTSCPKLLWYFSEELPEKSKKYTQYLEDTDSKCEKAFVLSIFNVTENDEGTYSCLFICEDTNTNTKAAVDLKVLVPAPTVSFSEVPKSTEYKTTSRQSHNFLAHSDSKPRETRRKWIQAALILSAGIVIILAALVVWFVVKGKRTSSSFKLKYCPKEKDFINQLFISHSSKDFGWVRENLISIIEKHSIAYSIHNRDFELGKPIVANMADSVYGSRQVLIVLSGNYLASNFCREELHMAVQREADAHDSSLILVKINELKKKQLPAALRKKRVLDFDKHKKKEDWEEKLLREILDGELMSVI